MCPRRPRGPQADITQLQGVIEALQSELAALTGRVEDINSLSGEYGKLEAQLAVVDKQAAEQAARCARGRPAGARPAGCVGVITYQARRCTRVPRKGAWRMHAFFMHARACRAPCRPRRPLFAHQD